MSARFAEVCRAKPLKLQGLELDQENISKLDGRTLKEMGLECERDGYLGLFFDGTNNNKFRDLPNNAGSNIARLFGAFIGGTPDIHITYTPSPKNFPWGNQALESKTVHSNDFSFYRKIYIPGVGTAFPEVKDPGENLPQYIHGYKLPDSVPGNKKRGLAFASQGEARIQWALLQTLNQVHYMHMGKEFEYLTSWLQEKSKAFEDIANPAIDSTVLTLFLGKANKKLAEVLSQRNPPSKCRTRKLRLSVFGFSRGAAEARSFVNTLFEVIGTRIGGIPFQIDMLGLFDTVASVGLAHIAEPAASIATPVLASPVLSPVAYEVATANGHLAWASGEKMVIPAAVKRCVHLVSAHEVRMCFPLDSIGQGGNMPENCKEIVYPGVHSDVGGGYGLWDQGRCVSDDDKISQISLAQMYREARMAGVPLATEDDMPGPVAALFNISAKLVVTFNNYVAKTRTGNLPPSKFVGPQSRMYPSETQPPEPLETIIHRHYGYYLAWRKFRLSNVYQLPGLKAAAAGRKAASAWQDIYDIWQLNEELKIELDPKKYSLIRKANDYLDGDQGFSATREIWKKANLSAADTSIISLYDLYVHDSRAWFKLGGESDDEWFGGGFDSKGNVRPSKKDLYRKSLEARRKELAKLLQMDLVGKHRFPRKLVELDPATLLRILEDPIKPIAEQWKREMDQTASRAEWKADLEAIDKEIALYEMAGDTLQAQGSCTQESLMLCAGYLRWRAIYATKDSKRDQWNLELYESCVKNHELRCGATQGERNEANKMEDIESYKRQIQRRKEQYEKDQVELNDQMRRQMDNKNLSTSDIRDYVQEKKALLKRDYDSDIIELNNKITALGGQA